MMINDRACCWENTCCWGSLPCLYPRMLLTTNNTNKQHKQTNVLTTPDAVGRIHAVGVGRKCGWQTCCWENELLGVVSPCLYPA